MFVSGRVVKGPDEGQYRVRYDGQGPEMDAVTPARACGSSRRSPEHPSPHADERDRVRAREGARPPRSRARAPARSARSSIGGFRFESTSTPMRNSIRVLAVLAAGHERVRGLTRFELRVEGGLLRPLAGESGTPWSRRARSAPRSCCRGGRAAPRGTAPTFARPPRRTRVTAIATASGIAANARRASCRPGSTSARMAASSAMTSAPVAIATSGESVRTPSGEVVAFIIREKRRATRSAAASSVIVGLQGCRTSSTGPGRRGVAWAQPPNEWSAESRRPARAKSDLDRPVGAAAGHDRD